MKINDCVKKITRYLSSDGSQPLIVDVANSKDLDEILMNFKVDRNEFISANMFSMDDELPKMDSLFEKISNNDKNLFVSGLSAFLMLQGETELHSSLKNILSLSVNKPVVVFTYQCEKYLQFNDPRIARQICFVSGEKTSITKLIFVPKSMSKMVKENSILGVHKIAEAMEKRNNGEIHVVSAKNKGCFPASMIMICNSDNVYEMLCAKDSSLTVIAENMGTADNWEYLSSLFVGNKMFKDVVACEFLGSANLNMALGNYNSYSENKKWLYFVALKIYGAQNNQYLDRVAKKLNNGKDFIQTIFRYILDIDYGDLEFYKMYALRKELIVSQDDFIAESIDYCKVIRQKEKNAIRYLTDASCQEKELLFELLDKYSCEFESSEIEAILSYVYPAVASYLDTYNFKNDLLNRYFSLYKYGKVTNKLSPELDLLVEEQAISRDYNSILEPRSSKLYYVDKCNSQLYFIDALGVEYLSYIIKKCSEADLGVKISIGCATLPTLTRTNKEFVKEFEGLNLPICSIKDLDELKHHGIEEYGYQKTTLPIHLIKELEIIDKIINEIKLKLAQDICQKVIVVSDHGTSRLAVIKEDANICTMNGQGEHSGRCCLKCEGDVQPEFAASENGYWVMANYGRFKGGRRSIVEVHGGATIEEVAVPIIEIFKLEEKLEIKVITPEITVQRRENAVIKLFSTSKLEDAYIVINGVSYDAEAVDENIYRVEILGIRKANEYSFDLYSGDNQLAEGLTFIIKSKAIVEKNML